MLIRLLCKRKGRFIDGSLPCPTGDQRSSWIICNGVVTDWIVISLSKDIYAIVNFTDSTYFEVCMYSTVCTY